jgi:hypothetical protein
MLGSVSSHLAAVGLVVAGFGAARSVAAPLRSARQINTDLFRDGSASVWPISSGIGGVRDGVHCGSSETAPKVGDCSKLINGYALQGWGDQMYVAKGEEVWYTFGQTVELTKLQIDQRGWLGVSNCDDDCKARYSASASGTFTVLTLDPATRTWVTLVDYVDENAALYGTKDYGLIETEFSGVLSNGVKIVSNGGDPSDTWPDHMQIAEIKAGSSGNTGADRSVEELGCTSGLEPHQLETGELACVLGCDAAGRSDASNWAWNRGFNYDQGTCAASKHLEEGCAGPVTYAEAEAICAANGAYICAADELDADVAKFSGCGFDTDLVWARDTTTGECALGERLVNPGASEYSAHWHDGLYAQCVDASTTTASVRCCAPRTPSL